MVCLVLTVSFVSIAQVKFQMELTTDAANAEDVIQTSDGSYVIAGLDYGNLPEAAWVTKLNGCLYQQWSKTYSYLSKQTDVSSIQETSDGGFIVCGEYDFDFSFVMKLDADGNVVWAERIKVGIRMQTRINQVIQVSDGGYVIVGSATQDVGAMLYDAYLMKLDTLGNMEWVSTYGDTGDDQAWSVVETADSGFIFVGYTASSLPLGLLVVKVSSTGELVWHKNHSDGSGGNSGFLYKIISTSDGNFLACGYSSFIDDNALLFKFDPLGNIIWSKRYESPDNEDELFKDVVETPDGGFACVGKTYGFSAISRDVILIRTNANGVEQFSKAYYRNTYEDGNAIDICKDDGFIMAGWDNSGFYVIKTDTLGISGCNERNITPNEVNVVMAPLAQLDTTSMIGSVMTISITVTDINDTSRLFCGGVIPLILDLGNDTIICSSDSVSITAPFFEKYLWSTTDTTQSIIANTVGSYSLVVTDSLGCKAEDTIGIFNPTALFNLMKDTIICSGINLKLSASGGLLYQWNPSTGLNNDTIANPIANINSTTQYTVTIQDSFGCITFVDSVLITIDSVGNLKAFQDTSIDAGQTVNLSVTGGSNYLWTPDIGLSCSQCSNPNVSPVVTTNYIVRSGIPGCYEFDTITITIKHNYFFVIPSAFTPDGDGNNDLIGVFFNEIPDSYIMTIYNRWGKKVFLSKTIDEQWDGKYNGKVQEIGTYPYELSIVIDSEEFFFKGSIALIR